MVVRIVFSGELGFLKIEVTVFLALRFGLSLARSGRDVVMF